MSSVANGWYSVQEVCTILSTSYEPTLVAILQLAEQRQIQIKRRRWPTPSIEVAHDSLPVLYRWFYQARILEQARSLEQNTAQTLPLLDLPETFWHHIES